MIIGKRDKKMVEDLKEERLELVKYNNGLSSLVESYKHENVKLKEEIKNLKKQIKESSKPKTTRKTDKNNTK